jgi:hypothetical protein
MLTDFPNELLETKEAPAEGQERLIVELDSDYNPLTGELPKVKVCFQKWAGGIGWFNQKSLYLTIEQAAFLKKEIEHTTANLKMKTSQPKPDCSKRSRQARGNSTGARAETGNPVIQFPVARTLKPVTDKPGPDSDEGNSPSTARILPFRFR